jgi:hypothetical protein
MRTRIPPGLRILRTVLIADDESSMRLLVHATIESPGWWDMPAPAKCS